MKVLSVDDSRSVHSFLNICLKKPEYEITHVYSGEDAKSLLTEGKIAGFDFILLDWEMPGLTGLEVLDMFRAAGVTIPIIMLTSKNKPEDMAMAFDKGADEYILKPFTPENIKEKIASVLGN